MSEGTGWDRQPFDNPLVREMEDGTYTTVHVHLRVPLHKANANVKAKKVKGTSKKIKEQTTNIKRSTNFFTFASTFALRVHLHRKIKFPKKETMSFSCSPLLSVNEP